MDMEANSLQTLGATPKSPGRYEMCIYSFRGECVQTISSCWHLTHIPSPCSENGDGSFCPIAQHARKLFGLTSEQNSFPVVDGTFSL